MKNTAANEISYAEVFPGPNCWCVRYTSEPMKSEVTRLFGTNELPTPFPERYSFDKVAAMLRTLKGNERTAFVQVCA